ncbi:MAG: STAS domain-containing protein [Chitinivibrionales bacterium]|nr:STAS domain-containing protein [Chitinivibrionales bacterium]
MGTSAQGTKHMETHFIRSHSPSTTTIAIEGQLRSGNMQTFFDHVKEALKSDCRSLKFDLSKVNFLDSSTIGTLIYMKRMIEEFDKSLTLVISDTVQKIFNSYGLYTVFKLEQDGIPSGPN